MTLTAPDKVKLAQLLEQLSKAIEDLLLTGLTTASDATRQTLNVSVQEASRFGLLRLGGTLRVLWEELSRYTRNDPDFSRKRFCFFLNRAWILSRGMAKALREDDDSAFERLKWTPATQAVKSLEVVTLGVGKKVVPNTFCAFDFRLRSLSSADGIDAGQKLIWSSVFPVKPGSEVPAEGYLHLPQKQKFNASCFLEGRVIKIENAAVAFDNAGLGRISLGEQSTIVLGDKYEKWADHYTFDPQKALDRLKLHDPGPLDLDIEMQEEVYLEEWELGDFNDDDLNESQISFPIKYKGAILKGVLARGKEGDALREHLIELRNAKKLDPLFGLMHYEKCNIVVQPLSTAGKHGPEHLMISKQKIDRVALLKALNLGGAR